MAECFTKLVDNHPKSWPEHLPEVQLAYNAAKHSSTGVAPYELVFKAHPRTKFDIVAERVSPETVEQQTILLEEKGEEVYERARARDADASRRRIEKHNQIIKPFQPLQVGEKVWKKKMKKRTFTDSWEGPFVIVRPKTKRGTSYIIRRVGGMKERTVHYNHLKPYVPEDRQRREGQLANKENKKDCTTKEVRDNHDREESSESESEDEEAEELLRRYPLRIRRVPERLYYTKGEWCNRK